MSEYDESVVEACKSVVHAWEGFSEAKGRYDEIQEEPVPMTTTAVGQEYDFREGTAQMWNMRDVHK